MTLGEVIGKICEHLGNWDNDCAIHMLSSIYSIEVEDNRIVIHFVDGNTSDIEIPV